MSAIVGLVNFDHNSLNRQNSSSLMKALECFPADDIQAWDGGNVFLGCHAQWITPESIGERLPYYDSNSKLAITADAIIDNRMELFEKLHIKHVDRQSITDSKLILLSYQKWGEETPKYLIGDFAFMIWDERNQTLFGARDFSGTRTLYYHQHKNLFTFSTTIQPLLTMRYIHKQLNEEWLAEFLAISSVVDTVDVSITPYKDIYQIPPSHSITVVRDKLAVKRYCTLSIREHLKFKTSDEYVEAFKGVFDVSIKSRLRTYRNVGSHLSGGLDSGAIVGFAAKHLKKIDKPLHTFSYIPPSDFNDYTPNYLLPDEREFIYSTVQYIGGVNDHYYDFNGRNPLLEVDDFLQTMEMPYKFFENSFWVKGIFEKASELEIGVLLSGGRGNLSISWGSALDYYALLLKRLKWIQLIRELHKYSRNVGGPRLGRIPLIARIAFPAINRAEQPGLPRSLINNSFAAQTKVYEKLQDQGVGTTGWLASSNIYKQRENHFEKLFHWNATNTLGTKLSLKYSLWKRDPTNDLRVIRFCLSVPEEQYVQNGVDRLLIRRSTDKLLPDKVRLNQRIRGVQGADWVHRMIPYWDQFLKELQQLSKDERILKYLDGNVIKAAIENAAEPKPEYATHPDYRLLMRALIVYRFLNNFT
ncbi:MAG: lasso peptide isopeptide bond-forming cyclase [Neobacillus sp.]|jgi:asparagine synthase (glutamine-hydrolysing)